MEETVSDEEDSHGALLKIEETLSIHQTIALHMFDAMAMKAFSVDGVNQLLEAIWNAAREGDRKRFMSDVGSWYHAYTDFRVVVNFARNMFLYHKDGPVKQARDLVEQWVHKNPWFDIQGNNDESKKALVIVHELIAGGLDPAEGVFWAEIERRVREEFPHQMPLN